MSCKLLSQTGSQSCVHLSPKSFSSKLKTSHLSINTHLPKTNISIKTSYTTIIRKATTINSLYTTTEHKHNFYDLLGVPKNGCLLEIKQAYKRLALKYHPDVSPPELKDECTKTFVRVQEAYKTLSDPKTRASYDRLNMDTNIILNSANTSNWVDVSNSQLRELKHRSMMKNSRGINMSWAARVRRQTHKSMC